MKKYRQKAQHKGNSENSTAYRQAQQLQSDLPEIKQRIDHLIHQRIIAERQFLFIL
jgi:hypothetical protein